MLFPCTTSQLSPLECTITCKVPNCSAYTHSFVAQWPLLSLLFFSLLPSEAETQNINLMNYWDDLFNWYGNLKGLLACSLAKYHGHLAERCPKGTDISISPTEYTLQRMIWKSFLCEEKAHETTLILPPSKTSLCASQHRPTVTAMWRFASHSIVLTQKYHTLFFLLRIDWIRQFEYWQLASQKGKIFPKELQSLRTICNSHSAAYKNELYFLQRCKHLTKNDQVKTEMRYRPQLCYMYRSWALILSFPKNS